MSSLKSDRRKRFKKWRKSKNANCEQKKKVKQRKVKLLSKNPNYYETVTVNLTVVKFFINGTQLLLSSGENSDCELNCG